MLKRVTCRPYNASEVFVTGTFDDWGKTVKLDRVGDTFLKKVTISPVQKVHYKVSFPIFLVRRWVFSFPPFSVSVFGPFTRTRPFGLSGLGR